MLIQWILAQGNVPLPPPPPPGGGGTGNLPPLQVPFPPPGGGGTGNLPPAPPIDGSGDPIDPMINSATEILQQSLNLTQNTANSWDELWNYTIFDSEKNFLWDNLVNFGLELAVVSLLYLVLTEGGDFLQQQDYSSLVTMFIWPLVVVFFLSNNGYMLSKTIQLTRTIALTEINQIYAIQINNMSLHDALVKYQVSSNAVDGVNGAFIACKDKSGDEYLKCIRRQSILARTIYDRSLNAVNSAHIGGGLPGVENYLGDLATNSIPTDPTLQYYQRSRSVNTVIARAFKSGYVAILKTIGYWIQWGFANIIEVSLLLSALVSPLALGLSLMPIQGRPIIGWVIGYFALWGIPIGYAIVVGLGSWVLVNSQLEAVADAAFLAYLTIFAPSLAAGIMTLNGIAIHQGVVSNINEIKNVVSEVLSFGTSMALKMATGV